LIRNIRIHPSATAVAILVVWLGTVVRAQPSAGDLVVAGADSLLDGHIKRIDAQSGVSVMARIQGAFPTALTLAPDNRHLIVALGVSPYVLIRVAPDGTISTLLTVAEPVQALDLDHSGRLVAVAGTLKGRLFEIDPSRRAVITLHQTPDVPAAGAVDRETGDLDFGRRSPVPFSLFRFDPVLKAVTTVASNLGDVATSMISDPETGEMLVSFSGPAGKLIRVDASGRSSTVMPAAYARAIKVAQDGTLWVLHQQGSFSGVTRYDRAGKPLKSVPFISLLGTTGLEIYGGRPLHGSGTAQVGTRYGLQIDLPESSARGKAYALAASFGQRPPIRLPGGSTLYLRVDPLLLISARNALPLFGGFQGMLDANGHGAAFVDIPSWARGLRLYFAGVVLDPRAPGAFGRVFNTLGVTFR
jgi:hypothetical protein